MNDIIIVSKDVKEHIHQVNDIVTTLGDAEMTLKLKKRYFSTDFVHCLGPIINPGRMEIDQLRTKILLDAKLQTWRSALRSFRGLWNIYRRLIPYFKGIAHLLKNKL